MLLYIIFRFKVSFIEKDIPSVLLMTDRKELPIFTVGSSETVKKDSTGLENGREDSVKETYERCLSRSIITNSELLKTVRNLLQLVKKVF